MYLFKIISPSWPAYLLSLLLLSIILEYDLLWLLLHGPNSDIEMAGKMYKFGLLACLVVSSDRLAMMSGQVHMGIKQHWVCWLLILVIKTFFLLARIDGPRKVWFPYPMEWPATIRIYTCVSAFAMSSPLD